MFWTILSFIAGCALLAEIIYCLLQANSTTGYTALLCRPFGYSFSSPRIGMFVRILLLVMMLGLFWYSLTAFFG